MHRQVPLLEAASAKAHSESQRRPSPDPENDPHPSQPRYRPGWLPAPFNERLAPLCGLGAPIPSFVFTHHNHEMGFPPRGVVRRTLASSMEGTGWRGASGWELVAANPCPRHRIRIPPSSAPAPAIGLWCDPPPGKPGEAQISACVTGPGADQTLARLASQLRQFVMVLVERLHLRVEELVLAYACVERALLTYPTLMRTYSVRSMLLGGCVIACKVSRDSDVKVIDVSTPPRPCFPSYHEPSHRALLPPPPTAPLNS